MLNISHIINSSAFSPPSPFVIERATGCMADGLWVSDAPRLIPDVIGSITPATADDMLKLPEGERQAETFRLITQTKLNISKNSAEADIVIYNDARYRVFAPSNWSGNGFYDVLIIRESND